MRAKSKNSSRNLASPQKTNSSINKDLSPTNNQKQRIPPSKPSQKTYQSSTINNGDGGLSQSREQMIQKYFLLADQYRAELKRRDELHEKQLSVQKEIASIFIQGDRLNELIKKVKETKQPEASND